MLGRIGPKWALATVAAAKWAYLYSLGSDSSTPTSLSTTFLAAGLVDVAGLYLLLRGKVPAVLLTGLAATWIFIDGCLLWSSALSSVADPHALGLRGERARAAQVVDASRHLRGQRTIRRKPHGTAQLVVDTGSCVCVNAQHDTSMLVRFSHTTPSWVTYGIKPSDDPTAKVQVINETIPSSNLAATSVVGGTEDADEYALIRGLTPAAQAPAPAPNPDQVRAPWRQRGQVEAAEPELLLRLPVKSAGRVRLLRAADALGREATINPTQSAELIVAECPVAAWDSTPAPLHACKGDDVELPVQVQGVGPLELGWSWAPLSNLDSTPNLAARVERRLSQLSDKVAEDEALSNSSAALDWARQQQIPLSLRFAPPIPTNAPAQTAYEVRLDAIRDVCGNLNPSPPPKPRQVYFHPRPHVHLAPVSMSGDAPLLAGPRTLAKLETSSKHHAEQSIPAIAVSAPDADGQWKATLRFVSNEGQTKDVPVEGNAGETVRIVASEPGMWSVASAGSADCAPRPPAPDLSPVLNSAPGPAPVKVAAVPPPTTNITLAPISDACAGPVGVRATAKFTGTPPYTLTYHVKGGGQDLERIWSTESREAEITLDVPPQVLARRGKKVGGDVHYAFKSLRDKYYDFATLDGPQMRQTVHPPLMAALAPAQQRYASTCSNDTFVPRVSLSGSGPLTLTYSLSGDGGSATHTIEGLQPGTDVPLDVDLPAGDPSSVESKVAFTLQSVKDARGCTAKIPSHHAGVHIRRRLAAPHAGFATTSSLDAEQGLAGVSRLAEGHDSSLPLHVTGRGPWTLTYSLNGGSMTVHTVRSASAGAATLDVDQPGLYTLHSVRDADCPGFIEHESSSWQVGLVPRPSVAFASSAGEAQQDVETSWLGSKKPRGPSTLVRRPVCLRQPDDAPLTVVPGESWPVQIVYEHSATVSGSDGVLWRSAEEGVRQVVDAHTFSAAQGTTFLPLNTSVPGLHTYILSQVGDDVYPPSRLPQVARLEQVVHPPPSARFVEQHTVQACVGDTIPTLSGPSADAVPKIKLGGKVGSKSRLGSSKAKGGKGGKVPQRTSRTAADVQLPAIELNGVAPFTLDLALISPNGTRKTHILAIPSDSTSSSEGTTTTQVNLGSALPLDTAGKWTISILGVQDGACAAPAGREGQEVVLDVHDTPSARPATEGEMCVGNVLGFGLSGQAPWEVTYIFTPSSALGGSPDYSSSNAAALAAAEADHGMTVTATTSSSMFTRLASTPGRVRLVRVAHPGSPCAWSPAKGTEEDFAVLVRDLPSVNVDHGAPDEQTLFEGATALVRFTLEGEPPFSFTYQRTEPVDLHARPKVLDTQTVNRVDSHEYSLSTAEEGTWHVIELADKYCAVTAASEARGAALLKEHGKL